MTVDNITVDKKTLFQLMHSHSRLAQAEYLRNPAYNDSHFSAVAEHSLIESLTCDEVVEYVNYITAVEEG